MAPWFQMPVWNNRYKVFTLIFDLLVRKQISNSLDAQLLLDDLLRALLLILPFLVVLVQGTPAGNVLLPQASATPCSLAARKCAREQHSRKEEGAQGKRRSAVASKQDRGWLEEVCTNVFVLVVHTCEHAR